MSESNAGPNMLRYFEEMINAVEGLVDLVDKSKADTNTNVKSQIQSLASRLDDIETRLDGIHGRITVLENESPNIGESSIEERVTTLEEDVDTLLRREEPVTQNTEPKEHSTAPKEIEEILIDTLTTKGITMWWNARSPIFGGLTPNAMWAKATSVARQRVKDAATAFSEGYYI